MRKVPIAIVGLHFGQQVLREQIIKGPASKHFRLVGVCSKEQDVSAQVASEFGVRAYDTLEQVLADDSIEAVGLFTGPVGRAELVSQCVRSGKHVITTKPFDLDPDRTLTAFRDARAFKRIIHLNSPAPLPSDDLAKIAEWRKEYNLGRLVGCRAEAWASYREEPDGSWYDDPDRCPVAPIFRLGIYLINDFVRLFGAAEKVSVLSSRLLTHRPTPDNAQLSIQFHKGELACIYASFCIGDGENRKNSMTLNFERGTIYRNVGPLPADHAPGQAHLSLVMDRGQKRITKHASTKSMSGEYQWDAFYKAIQGEKLPGEITAAHVAEGLRIIAAMRRAELTGKVEAV